MKIIYSKKYLKYHFEEGHPFWPERAEEFIKKLDAGNGKLEIVDAPKCTDEDILLVHTKDYLEKVKKLAKKKGYLTMDTQVNPDNLEAAYYSVGGTIEASKLALRGRTSINTLGGLHHAETNNSSGFCIFNDHAVAIRKLQKAYRENSKFESRNPKQINKSQISSHKQKSQNFTVAVLDLDVHAGNGTQEIFYDDPSVLTISVHQDPTNFYPGTGFPEQTGEGEGEGFNINYVLQPGTTEKEYLPILEKAIEKIKGYEPLILFVVLGVDTYKKDPLASIKLEKETYGKIARRLRNLGTKEIKNLPMVILFAGGYSKDVPELWREFVSNLE